jgi:hypothetical protein
LWLISMRSPVPANITVWSPTMSPPRMVAKPMVDGSRFAGVAFAGTRRTVARSTPQRGGATSPICSAVPLGASTLWRWCASITSMS